MIWQQPIAWAGLVALALPVIIHLLGRGDARTVPFPSLRFVRRTRLLPTRRTRLRDLLLLALRVLTLAVAVAALAQPLWSTPERTRAFASTLSRAVVVDTSAEDASAGARKLAAARRLADSAAVHVLIATSSLERSIDGAVSWLRQQPTRAELVIVSDFPSGELSSEQLRRVPRDIGVRLVRARGGRATIERDAAGATPEGALAAARDSGPPASAVTLGDATFDLRTSLSGAPGASSSNALPPGTSASWTSRRSVRREDTLALTLVGGAEERAALALALDAARHSIALRADSARVPSDDPQGVTIVTPHAPDRTALLQSSIAVRSTWMLHAVAQLHESELLRDAALNASPLTSTDSTKGIPVVTDRHGAAVVVAREGIIDGSHRLLLLVQTSARDFSVAALTVAVRELQADRDRAEREPSVLSDSVLISWERPPATDERASMSSAQLDSDQGPSDARWFWFAVLVLIGAEQLLRRSARSAVESS